VHFVLGIAVITALAGLGGLYSVMSPKLSAFGRISFGFVLLANVLLAGVMLFFEATLLPALSRNRSSYRPGWIPARLRLSGIPGVRNKDIFPMEGPWRNPFHIEDEAFESVHLPLFSGEDVSHHIVI
jgi:hypothetical protein